MQFSTLVSGVALFATLAVAQVETLAGCGKTCYDSLVTSAGGLGCEGGDLSCLCRQEVFQFGMADCANESCPSPPEAAAQVDIVRSYCANIGEAWPNEEEPVQPETPSEQSNLPPSTSNPAAAPATTDQSTSLATPASSAAAEPSEAIDDSSDPVLTSSATDEPQQPSPTPTPTAATDTVASSDTPSSTPTASADNSDNDDQDEDTSEDESEDESDSGLSQAARVGLGIGIAVAVLLAVLAVLFFLRRRKNKSGIISKPLPGSGRTYGGAQSFSEKNASELELTSRRYEDMLPRQQPRQVV